MATKTKIISIAAIVISLIVFILEFSGAFAFLSDKLLLKHDYIGENKLVFVDVDDGNCAIIQSGDKTAIINFGGVLDGGNSLIKAIRKYRITKVDYAFVNLSDENHLGGFISISDLVDINKVVIPNLEDFTDNNSVTSLAVKEEILNHYNYEIVELNKNYQVGEFTVTPFYYKPNILIPNGRAVIYKVFANEHSAIIGGSFHKDIMYELLAQDYNLKTDIFLIPGFSSGESLSLPFINSLNAKYLISSSAFKNDYYIQQDIEFLKKNHNIYRTDINGDIVFYFNKDGLILKTER